MIPILLPYKLVFRALSLLLVGTAALKLYGLSADPVSRRGVFAAPELQLAVVEVELLLALWLWGGGGKAPLGPWLSAGVLFASFAGASFYMGWIGQTSCGCAGAAVSVSPWYAFGLDLFVLVMLLLGRPDLRAAWAEPRRHLLRATLPAALGVGGVMLFSLAMLGTASVSFGSVAAAIAYLRNDRVSIGPRLLDLGTAEAGKEIEFAVDVTNWTDQPVRVIGGAQDCSCTLPGHLPLTIAPRETQAIAVSVRLPSKAGIFTRKVGLFIEDEGFRRTSFTLTGRVSPSGVKDPDGG